MWTMTNGKCYDGDGYHEKNDSRRTKPEQCQYLLRCLLSRGAEASCPCSSNVTCQLHLNKSCSSFTIPYPSKGIMAPYILFYYNRMRNTSNLRPDSSWINGSIKCYGKLRHLSGYLYPYISTLRHVEDSLCSYGKNESSFDRYDCSNLTTNRTSGSVSMCLRSRKCISTSRLRDGFTNCLDQTDELRNRSTDSRCSQSERFRFSCSIDEPTCLSVAALGNVQVDCTNSFDEVWLGNRTKLININCNQLWKYECPLLRRYVWQSWEEQQTTYAIAQTRIPFRSYSDTFWDLARREDEDLVLCQRSWTCPEQQWQCPTGQCIEKR